MLTFAANLSWMFKEHDFLDRFAAAADAGFEWVEYLFPYDHDPQDIAERLSRNKLKLAPFKRPLTVEYGSWAVQKGNTPLAGYLSKFICKAQNNGTLGRFYQKAEGTPLPPMPRCK